MTQTLARSTRAFGQLSTDLRIEERRRPSEVPPVSAFKAWLEGRGRNRKSASEFQLRRMVVLARDGVHGAAADRLLNLPLGTTLRAMGRLPDELK